MNVALLYLYYMDVLHSVIYCSFVLLAPRKPAAKAGSVAVSKSDTSSSSSAVSHADTDEGTAAEDGTQSNKSSPGRKKTQQNIKLSSPNK